MKVCLVYHHVPGLVTDVGETQIAADRFYQTYKAFDPGYPHELIWNLHDSPGRDIAAHQAIAPYLDCDFAVFMCARVFFWKDGWLKRLVEAREKHGDGLYGAMSSLEACPLEQDHTPNPHIRTCFFGMRPKFLRSILNDVVTKECGFRFESSRSGLTGHCLFASNWCNAKGEAFTVRMVTWDGSYELNDWRKPENVYRKGDQSNLIAFDRHTSIYDAATTDQKSFLEKIANGEHP